MQERIYHTASGDIHYWFNQVHESQPTLVFLPGLTADHRMFEKQVEYFAADNPDAVNTQIRQFIQTLEK